MAEHGKIMGINVASDRKTGRRYADMIVDGHKTLESRVSDSLRPYVGKRVAIVRTGEGLAKAIGEVTIGEPMLVNKQAFRALEHKHLVPEGSIFDINTPTKYLYPMHDPVRYEKELDVGHGIVSRKVLHKATGGSMNSKYPSVEEMIQKLQEAGRIPIVPTPNRWYANPEKYPHQQKLIERVLAQTGHGRESFPSGSFINPQTGEPLDFDIMHDLRVAIDPSTGRPMMSGVKSGLSELDPSLGSITRSNLVRKGLFKHEGGDKLLKDLAFLATIEKGGKGHHYGLSTQYESPAELVNTMTGANPTLRPHSRGDIYGIGDEVGRISIQGKHHPVYEKLLVAPAGSNVQGKKLHKAKGGITHAHHLEIRERAL